MIVDSIHLLTSMRVPMFEMRMNRIVLFRYKCFLTPHTQK